MASGNPLLNALNRVSLVAQIAIGLVLGILVGAVSPQVGISAGLLGSLFVGALKAIAPILVFVLVTAAIAQHQKGNQAYIKPILILYIFGTFAAAVVAVVASMVFPTTLILRAAGDVSVAPPSGIIEVLKTLLMNLVANPINALANANYIGILAWALILGAALRHHGSDTTRQVAADLADTVSTVVKWIIRFAPLGIFGLVSSTIAETGFEALAGYMQLLAVLLGCMLFIALVVNPIIVWTQIRSNPFPLVFTCLRESGLYAFFTRSPQLTLETYAYNRPDDWLNAWTLFFWAWWIAWAAFVGMFLARISRGRTIRQFVLGSLLLPFCYILMWVAIFGNHALDLVIRGNGEFRDITLERPEQGLYWILEHLPGQKILIALALFVGILFYVTSADSGALVMANLSSRIRSARQDAAAWLRIFWAALTGILTIAMLVAGGIPILQQATIVMALPFSGVLILIMYTLWRSLSTEDTYNQALSRADRNRALGFNGSAAGLEQTPWRERLAHTLNSVSPDEAGNAMERRIVPALEAVATELRKENVSAEVFVEGPEAQDPDDERTFLGRASLVVSSHPATDSGEEQSSSIDSFRYVVRMVVTPVPAYGFAVHEADDLTVRLEVRPHSGGQGYDVVDWNSDQVAHDVLDHYERWLEYVGTSEKSESRFSSRL